MTKYRGPRSLDSTTVGKATACPYCGKRLDRFTGDRGVREGDVSICIACAGILVVTEDLDVRKPTADEEPSLISDPGICRLQAAIRLVAPIRKIKVE